MMKPDFTPKHSSFREAVSQDQYPSRRLEKKYPNLSRMQIDMLGFIRASEVMYEKILKEAKSGPDQLENAMDLVDIEKNVKETYLAFDPHKNARARHEFANKMIEEMHDIACRRVREAGKQR